jgi:hypothetical protein
MVTAKLLQPQQRVCTIYTEVGELDSLTTCSFINHQRDNTGVYHRAYAGNGLSNFWNRLDTVSEICLSQASARSSYLHRLDDHERSRDVETVGGK